MKVGYVSKIDNKFYEFQVIPVRNGEYSCSASPEFPTDEHYKEGWSHIYDIPGFFKTKEVYYGRSMKGD